MFGKKLAVTIVIVVAVAISGVALAAETVRTDGMKPGWQKALTTAAIGASRPDDRATHGQGRIALEQASVVVHPDNRATHGPGAVTIWESDVVRPDDRAAHGPGVIEPLSRAGQFPLIAPGGSGTARDGFDWLDAASGAAVVLGLGLIISGGVAFLLRRRATREAIVSGKKLAVTIVIVVAVAISGAALAAETVSTDVAEPAWQKALAIRSEALNRKYHLGSSKQRVAANPTPVWAQALAIRSEALNRKYHLGSSKQRVAANPTPVWAQALAIRSEALNRKYHLAKHAGR